MLSRVTGLMGYSFLTMKTATVKPADRRSTSDKWRANVERLLLVLGLALLALYVATRIHSAVLSRAAVLSFEASQTQSSVRQEPSGGGQGSFRVDFSLWSEQRIHAYKQSLAQHFDQPLALLRVARIELEVPVLDGTDDLTLNRGVGRIVGTARPGARGNIGIAGHRDGFFRGLKDLKVGDTIDLVMRDRTDTYAVDEIQIVNPDNIRVLRAGTTPSLTLVTCYPFYFVGSAPQRYIVHALLADSDRPSNRGPKLQNSKVPNKNNQEITK
jgi:sortase A